MGQNVIHDREHRLLAALQRQHDREEYPGTGDNAAKEKKADRKQNSAKAKKEEKGWRGTREYGER
jgi:hypothetical protein